VNQANVIIQRFFVKIWMYSCSVLVNAGQESVFRKMQSKVQHLKRRAFAALRRC
jgi:hypothetical protein